MKPSYARLENNLKELKSAYNKQCVVLNWKRNFIDSINEALGITPHSQEVTGENALDAITELKKQIASAEKNGYKSGLEQGLFDAKMEYQRGWNEAIDAAGKIAEEFKPVKWWDSVKHDITDEIADKLKELKK